MATNSRKRMHFSQSFPKIPLLSFSLFFPGFCVTLQVSHINGDIWVVICISGQRSPTVAQFCASNPFYMSISKNSIINYPKTIAKNSLSDQNKPFITNIRKTLHVLLHSPVPRSYILKKKKKTYCLTVRPVY